MENFSDKTLLITGGTGSFGNAVLKRFLNSKLKEIRIFSRDEKKQDDMRRRYQNTKIKFFIGDVRNKDSIKYAMAGVDFVFHAAALKQVPSCEFFPMEAVKTNIIGTNNVLDVAIDAAVSKVICLSTDKAAYPINAMGISKAMMEKVIVAKSRIALKSKTTIACTRYGNVMASRGSVIPLFINQIIQNKDITITNPNMTRFLMSLEEAVELVYFAFKNAKSGDLFIQKSPASTILDLAEAIKDLFDSQNNVRIIGTRHGEKLYETLMTLEERIKAIDMGEYFKIPMDDRDLNYDKYFSKGIPDFDDVEAYTSHNTTRLNNYEIRKKLESIGYVKSEHEKWIKK